ncbi:hypothetical protein N9H39_11965 [Gammaproteobacteria bacterium]|nr:hypothetical protein [Gammaproteobacteria bacterium]
MNKYDPSQAPDPEEWQTLEESERIELVREFHIDAEEEIPEAGETLHVTIHVIVENQIATGTEPVPSTIAKLIHQGLSRHEAIHAVGAVLSTDMFDLLEGDEESWKPQRYRRRLEKLTAKRWKKGRW